MLPPHALDRMYRTFYEISPDLICTLDEKGILLDVNKHMLEHLGYTKDEVVGKSCYDFIADGSKVIALNGFKEMIEKGTVPQIEIEIIKKNKKSISGLCKGAVIPNEFPGKNSYLVTIQDISILQKALQRAHFAEEQADKRYTDLKKTHENLLALEEKYRNLYEHSPDLLRTIDLHGVILDCNESYATNLGYTKEEIIGKTVIEHTAERSCQDLADGIEEWKKTGKISNLEIWLKRKDGSVFPTLLSGTSLYDENNNVMGRTVSFRDITNIHEASMKMEQDQKKIKEQYDELKKTYGLLSTTEQKFRSLYDTSPDMMRTIDENGIITDCNDSYASNLGYEKKDVLGRSILEHTAEKNMPQIKDTFNSWKRGIDIKNKEIWLKRKDNTIFPCLLSATTFHHGDIVLGSNTVIKDITELYQARKKIEENEARIKEQYEKLRQVEKSKEEFITMMTHELKTPLVPILGYVDMLLTEAFGTLTEPQKKRLHLIRANSQYLTNLISDLLDVQKIDLGQLKLTMEQNNLAEIILQAIDSIRPDLEKRNIAISTDLQPELFYTCDKLRMIQVINNLLHNALDFCPKTDGKISVKLYSDGTNYKIIIKDNGTGMQKDHLEKVFVKFYQIDTSATREHGGSGLGLAVCKGIVDLHKGKIWADSEGLGKGTEIHISLPIV
jgi:PAS domain S-box-containing protein